MHLRNYTRPCSRMNEANIVFFNRYQPFLISPSSSTTTNNSSSCTSSSSTDSILQDQIAAYFRPASCPVNNEIENLLNTCTSNNLSPDNLFVDPSSTSNFSTPNHLILDLNKELPSQNLIKIGNMPKNVSNTNNLHSNSNISALNQINKSLLADNFTQNFNKSSKRESFNESTQENARNASFSDTLPIHLKENNNHANFRNEIEEEENTKFYKIFNDQYRRSQKLNLRSFSNESEMASGIFQKIVDVTKSKEFRPSVKSSQLNNSNLKNNKKYSNSKIPIPVRKDNAILNSQVDNTFLSSKFNRFFSQIRNEDECRSNKNEFPLKSQNTIIQRPYISRPISSKDLYTQENISIRILKSVPKKYKNIDQPKKKLTVKRSKSLTKKQQIVRPSKIAGIINIGQKITRNTKTPPKIKPRIKIKSKIKPPKEITHSNSKPIIQITSHNRSKSRSSRTASSLRNRKNRQTKLSPLPPKRNFSDEISDKRRKILSTKSENVETPESETKSKPISKTNLAKEKDLTENLNKSKKSETIDHKIDHEIQTRNNDKDFQKFEEQLFVEKCDSEYDSSIKSARSKKINSSINSKKSKKAKKSKKKSKKLKKSKKATETENLEQEKSEPTVDSFDSGKKSRISSRDSNKKSLDFSSKNSFVEKFSDRNFSKENFLEDENEAEDEKHIKNQQKKIEIVKCSRNTQENQINPCTTEANPIETQSSKNFYQIQKIQKIKTNKNNNYSSPAPPPLQSVEDISTLPNQQIKSKPTKTAESSSDSSGSLHRNYQTNAEKQLIKQKRSNRRQVEKSLENITFLGNDETDTVLIKNSQRSSQKKTKNYNSACKNSEIKNRNFSNENFSEENSSSPKNNNLIPNFGKRRECESGSFEEIDEESDLGDGGKKFDIQNRSDDNSNLKHPPEVLKRQPYNNFNTKINIINNNSSSIKNNSQNLFTELQHLDDQQNLNNNQEARKEKRGKNKKSLHNNYNLTTSISDNDKNNLREKDSGQQQLYLTTKNQKVQPNYNKIETNSVHSSHYHSPSFSHIKKNNSNKPHHHTIQIQSAKLLPEEIDLDWKYQKYMLTSSHHQMMEPENNVNNNNQSQKNTNFGSDYKFRKSQLPSQNGTISRGNRWQRNTFLLPRNKVTTATTTEGKEAHALQKSHAPLTQSSSLRLPRQRETQNYLPLIDQGNFQENENQKRPLRKANSTNNPSAAAIAAANTQHNLNPHSSASTFALARNHSGVTKKQLAYRWSESEVKPEDKNYKMNEKVLNHESQMLQTSFNKLAADKENDELPVPVHSSVPIGEPVRLPMPKDNITRENSKIQVIRSLSLKKSNSGASFRENRENRSNQNASNSKSRTRNLSKSKERKENGDSIFKRKDSLTKSRERLHRKNSKQNAENLENIPRSSSSNKKTSLSNGQSSKPKISKKLSLQHKYSNPVTNNLELPSEIEQFLDSKTSATTSTRFRAQKLAKSISNRLEVHKVNSLDNAANDQLSELRNENEKPHSIKKFVLSQSVSMPPQPPPKPDMEDIVKQLVIKQVPPQLLMRRNPGGNLNDLSFQQQLNQTYNKYYATTTEADETSETTEQVSESNYEKKVSTTNHLNFTQTEQNTKVSLTQIQTPANCYFNFRKKNVSDQPSVKDNYFPQNASTTCNMNNQDNDDNGPNALNESSDKSAIRTMILDREGRNLTKNAAYNRSKSNDTSKYLRDGMVNPIPFSLPNSPNKVAIPVDLSVGLEDNNIERGDFPIPPENLLPLESISPPTSIKKKKKSSKRSKKSKKDKGEKLNNLEIETQPTEEDIVKNLVSIKKPKHVDQMSDDQLLEKWTGEYGSNTANRMYMTLQNMRYSVKELN